MSSWARTGVPPKKHTKGYYYQSCQAGFCSLFNNYFYTWLFARHKTQPLHVFDKKSPLGLNTPIFQTTFEPPPGVNFLQAPPSTPTELRDIQPPSKQEMSFFLLTQSPSVLRNEAREFFKLLSHVKEEVQQIASAVPSAFHIGIHMRAGDKITTKEMAAIPIDTYIRAAKSFDTKQQPFRIFLMSDTAALIQEFRQKAPSQWQIFTLPFSTIASHTQHDFNAQSKEAKHKAYIHFLAELECMRRCSKIICTFSSNVSRFLYLTTPSSTEFKSLDMPDYSAI